jgi:hypothetical protein
MTKLLQSVSPEEPLHQAALLRDRLERTNESSIKALLADFPELARVVLRKAPFAGRDLGGQDLTGLDFTGANLVGARFAGARIVGTRFDQARVARWQLREAADWRDHAAGWQPSRGMVPKMVIGGDRFADAPFAPEMVVVPREPGTNDTLADDLLPYERAALLDERLAVAILPVTKVQYAAFTLRHGHFLGWHDNGEDTPRLLAPADARQYLDWLRAVCAADYHIASTGLWRYLARRGVSAETEADAVTLEHHPGLTGPMPADTRGPPGQGRCDRLGLIDMIGNTREFVLEDASSRLAVIGGGYDESTVRACSLHVLRPVDHEQNTVFNGLRLVRLFPSPRG